MYKKPKLNFLFLNIEDSFVVSQKKKKRYYASTMQININTKNLTKMPFLIGLNRIYFFQDIKQKIKKRKKNGRNCVYIFTVC